MDIHVLVVDRKAKYPFLILKDYWFEDHVVPMGYQTDFASIPTRFLKNLLEPQHIIKCAEYVTGTDRIWFYEPTEVDGIKVPAIVGYCEDPIAHAAIIHDAEYSYEYMKREDVDKLFLRILRSRNVGYAYMMYIAVRIGGGFSYPHDKSEVQEDRQLRMLARARRV